MADPDVIEEGSMAARESDIAGPTIAAIRVAQREEREQMARARGQAPMQHAGGTSGILIGVIAVAVAVASAVVLYMMNS